MGKILGKNGLVYGSQNKVLVWYEGIEKPKLLSSRASDSSKPAINF